MTGRVVLDSSAAALLIAAVMALGYADQKICAQASGVFRFMSAGVIAVLTAAVIMVLYLFPVMAQTGGKLADQVKRAFFTAMSSPLKMLLVLAVNCVMPVLMYLDEVNRPTYAFAGTFFAFGLGAWIIGKLLFPLMAQDSGSVSASRLAG